MQIKISTQHIPHNIIHNISQYIMTLKLINHSQLNKNHIIHYATQLEYETLCIGMWYQINIWFFIQTGFEYL